MASFSRRDFGRGMCQVSFTLCADFSKYCYLVRSDSYCPDVVGICFFFWVQIFVDMNFTGTLSDQGELVDPKFVPLAATNSLVTILQSSHSFFFLKETVRHVTEDGQLVLAG